ncbi:MAG TPA: carboxypeptidase-like regulatory domain-containing protein [Planctomycetota bacterium]|nr:carboxypeptidase-like regulatory domain-containing protein [Planctomycetota bacterium]
MAALASVSFSGIVYLERPWRTPVPGARVRASVLGSEEEIGAAITASDGAFSFRVELPRSGLPTDLNLRAEKEGLVTGAGSEHVVNVTMPPAGYGGLGLALFSPLEVFGTVVEARTGEPVADARVSQRGRHARTRLVRARTDATGAFRVRVPEEEEGYLLFEATGLLPASVPWTRSTIGLPLRVELFPEEETPWATGRVVDERGFPLSDIPVGAALGSGSAPPSERAGRVARASLAYLRETARFPEVRTDLEGRFRLLLPGFGTWTLWVKRDRQFAFQNIEVREVAAYRCDFRLLENRCVIAGSVRRRSDHSPIPQASVRVYGSLSGMGAEMTTDSDGEFRSPPLQRETFVCVVTAPPYPHEVREIQFAPESQEVRADIELEEACRVRGRVLDEEGNPVAGAGVRVDHKRWPFGVTADEAGQFEVGELPAGVVVTVEISPPGSSSHAETRRLTFEFPGEVRDLGDVKLRLR